MKEVAELLNSMLEEELIQDYALFGLWLRCVIPRLFRKKFVNA